MSNSGMPPGFDLNQLLSAAQKMQADMERAQGELGAKRVEGTSGGGMVTAVVNGRGELVSLRIDPAAVDPKEVGMLQDLVVAAVNVALRRAGELQQGAMSQAAGGLSPDALGPMLGGLFPK